MSKKTKKELNRTEKAKHDIKMKEDMKQPINRFLNAVDDAGKLKYPIALKLRNYFILRPDPILNAMRLGNALLHEMRFHKNSAKKYYTAYLSEKDKIELYGKDGRIMTKEECYTTYIGETQINYLVLSKLRKHLSEDILSVVDDDLFTFQHYNDYVTTMEIKLKELGYDLFPEKIVLIKPL